MMCSRLRIGMNVYSPGPELLCSHTGEVYRCCSIHTRSLGCVVVEAVTWDHTYAFVLPSLWNIGGRWDWRVIVGVVRHLVDGIGCCEMEEENT
jgi:hypothetical protein